MSSTSSPYGNFSQMSPQIVAKWAKSALALPHLRIVDTETNGHGPPWDNEPTEIVEISIIDSTGTVLLNSLVQSQATIHPDAAAKSGITSELLATAPRFSDIASQVSALLQDAAVVIYNADFDYPLLSEAFADCGQSFPVCQVRCAMLAYHAFRGRSSHERWRSLERACKDEGIAQTDAHRALGDCLSTLAVLHRMASTLG